MKNTSNKMKKWGIIAGLGLVCCVLVALIGGRFLTEPPVDSLPDDTTSVIEDVNPNPDMNVNKPNDIVIKPNTDPTPSDNGAISTGTEQTIQPDPIKPPEPTKPDAAVDTSKPHEPPKDTTLTDPAKKPDSTPKPEEPTKPKEPDAGATNDKGQIYIPGFGWVANEGGGGQGEKTGSDGDWDKVIGH